MEESQKRSRLWVEVLIMAIGQEQGVSLNRSSEFLRKAKLLLLTKLTEEEMYEMNDFIEEGGVKLVSILAGPPCQEFWERSKLYFTSSETHLGNIIYDLECLAVSIS